MKTHSASKNCTKNTSDESVLSWRLGQLSFSLKGDGPIFSYLREEFEGLPKPEDGATPTLEIEIASTLSGIPAGSIVTKEYAGLSEGFQCHKHGLPYQVTRNNSKYKITIDKNGFKRHPWPIDKIYQFLDWNYLNAAQNMAKNFMYEVFNPLTGLLQVQNKAGCYLHASSFEKENFGVALVACGGIGKTTSALKIIAEHGWRYLSDDIALLDKNGFLVRTPLRMQIYAYNLIGNTGISHRLLSQRRPIDRLSWHIRLARKGPYRTRRRVTAEELFGRENVAHSAECKIIIFMERYNESMPFVCPLDKENLINRINCIMPKELGGLDDLSNNLELIDRSTILPSKSDYLSLSRKILESSLRNTKTFLLRIPLGFTPTDLSSFIIQFLEKEQREIN